MYLTTGRAEAAQNEDKFVDIRKIKALLAVVSSGSLTKAAEELSYTQSGLTHMMNSIEKELGVLLLTRGRSGISLTATGEYLLPLLRRLSDDYDELDSALHRLGGNSTPILRIGAYSSVSQHWLPGMVQRFKAAFPETDVMIRMINIMEIFDMVRRGEIDCAFASRQDGLLGELEWIPLRNDELVAVLPPDYPVDGTLFPVGEFEKKDFLMPSAGFDQDIMPSFAGSGVHPHIRYTNMDDPAIISMVEHGLGLSVLTELVMWGRHDNVRILPLRPPAYRELGIAIRRELRRSPALDAFIKIAQAEVCEIYRRA